MQKFISNKIDEVYNDFADELSKKRYYCDLKTFRFDGNNIPDYNNQLIQRYYLLRYMPAYIIEYYYIYKKMFGFNFLDHNPNIISIGCGCGLDLWGAKFAKDESCPDIDIQYTGIDTIDWEYKDNLNIEETYFIRGVYLKDIYQADILESI